MVARVIQIPKILLFSPFLGLLMVFLTNLDVVFCLINHSLFNCRGLVDMVLERVILEQVSSRFLDGKKSVV